jgi:hypothetical protein
MPPNLSNVDPRLIGPLTDFLTFYADLWLAGKSGKLKQAGDHFYQKEMHPNSWAEGHVILVGQDGIDFDVSLKDVDNAKNTATVLVRHVPPENQRVQLPAPWMDAKVGERPNNWVQVMKSENT